MCNASFYISIGSILGLVAGLIILHYTGMWGVMVEISVWIREVWNWFMNLLPQFARYLLFIFLLLIVFNTAVSGILSLTHSCTSTSELREYDGILSGVFGFFQCGLVSTGNLTSEEADEYILDTTIPATIYDDDSNVRSMMRVECVESGDAVSPRLTFYGVNFLMYRYWIMILLIGAIVSVYYKFK